MPFFELSRSKVSIKKMSKQIETSFLKFWDWESWSRLSKKLRLSGIDTVKTSHFKLLRLWEQSRRHFLNCQDQKSRSRKCRSKSRQVFLKCQDWESWWRLSQKLRLRRINTVKTWPFKLPRLSEQSRCHFLDCQDQKSRSRPCRDKPRHPITILKFGLQILITLIDFILIQIIIQRMSLTIYDHFATEPKW